VEVIKQKLQKEVYKESRCYPLCCFSTCFLFFYLFACLYVALIFVYCILTFFFFVYHFSFCSFVLLLFTCLKFFVFWLLCRFFLPWPIFLSIAFVEVLVSSKLFLFVEFHWCKMCHHFVALYFYSLQLRCVGFFLVYFYSFIFFPYCCASVFYYWHMCFLFFHVYIGRSWWSILFFSTYFGV